ncbi:MAG TPA: hypothetical protein VLG47_06465 [Candidatus Saccharimonadales bacterium]|nr:hypothetical protein [Candidatus Saccharimonadales bacterium]
MADLELDRQQVAGENQDTASLRYRVASNVAVGELAVGISFRDTGSGIPLIFQLCRVVTPGIGAYEAAPHVEPASGRAEDETSLSDTRFTAAMLGVFAAAMAAGEFADIILADFHRLYA